MTAPHVVKEKTQFGEVSERLQFSVRVAAIAVLEHAQQRLRGFGYVGFERRVRTRVDRLAHHHEFLVAIARRPLGDRRGR